MLSTLNVSQTGLNAAKIAVENVSNNIANENTPGYKKRVVQISELEQMDARFAGRGVNVDGTIIVGVTGEKLLTTTVLIVGAAIVTGVGGVGVNIVGIEKEASGGNTGLIAAIEGLPGVIGVTKGIDGFPTPRDIGCLFGSLTCIPIPKSISFGCCND